MTNSLWNAGAFIFDLDGTLVDNTPAHLRAWAVFLASQGREMGEAEFLQRFNGKTNADILRGALDRPLSPAEVEEFTGQKEAIYRDLYRPHLQPMPGLLEFLGRARDARIPMAVATSALPPNVEFVLGGLGLLRWFGAIITAQDVRNTKPHPEVFLTAAERLGAEPGTCVVFEDSLSGIEAARRAGMRAVAMTTTLRAEDFPAEPFLLRAAPDFIVLMDG